MSGEQQDGMDATLFDNGASHEETGFDTPATAEAPDLPPDPVGGGHKGIPGALVLPPSPPVGTETGQSPNPHPIKPNIVSLAKGAPATDVVPTPAGKTAPAREAAPAQMRLIARAASPTPFGLPQKTATKPVRPALTIGSVSLRGTIPMTVMTRPFLSLGTVSGTIDPPLPPAKGSLQARVFNPKRDTARGQDETQGEQAMRPMTATETAQPTEGEKPSPPVVKQAKNSQGIKNGTEQPLPPTPLPDSDMQVGDGSGLKGDYYSGRKFDQYVFSRADANINFDFTALPDGSPSPKIPPGTDYTARWTGKIAAKHSETYTLYATADDGVRVWINHKLLIDDWSLHAATEFANKFTFKAGEQSDIKVEYLESAGGAALVRLYWQSPSTPKEYIPEDAFFYPLPSDEEDMKNDKAPL